MIVYSGTKQKFMTDSVNGVIANRVKDLFAYYHISAGGISQYNAFVNSLPRIALVVGDRRIDDDVSVAIEYQIPLTSKRVDFMIGGSKDGEDNIVIVELKQWETCSVTDMENVVNTYTGGGLRDVAHPSQQAYSYARLIVNFNEDVRENSIGIIPCAYLHNFKEEGRSIICDSRYSAAIKDAPVFLEQDGSKLSEFIAGKVRHASEKNLFDIIESGKLKPSKSLQDTVGSILNGNKEFEMIDEQQVAYAKILSLVSRKIDDSRKHTIIVQGGPGTGKSVIAINLLAKILNNGYSCAYVTKNSAPRSTFQKSLIKGTYSLQYLKGLFKSSGSFYECRSDVFDCLLVDEAHRLNLKSGMYSNLGENQIKEIINASRISVFFIDEDQIVTMKDIGTIDEIKKQARLLGSVVHCDDSLKLTSQFRCNGSDGYIAFLDDLLGIRSTANAFSFDLEYDIKVFDSPAKMREALRRTNGNNKSRMIAGYCYPWVSDKDKKLMDIVLPDGFQAQWNFTTEGFATAPDSFEQVGCIHSTQGLEFDYVGIIIGLDMRYENGRVITDFKKRYLQRDKTIDKYTKNYALADRIIRNTYRTLLTRGQKGCYIYCEDKPLGDYIKKRLSMVNTKRF